jgi:hypothetical protein
LDIFVIWVALDIKRVIVLAPLRGSHIFIFIFIVDGWWWSSTTVVPKSGQPVSWSWRLLTIFFFSVRMTILVAGYTIGVIRIASIWAIRHLTNLVKRFSHRSTAVASVIFDLILALR